MSPRRFRQGVTSNVLLLAVLFVGAGPSLANPTAPDTPKVEEVDLRAAINELRRQAAMAEVELANLRRRVHQLETQLAGGPQASATAVDSTSGRVQVPLENKELAAEELPPQSVLSVESRDLGPEVGRDDGIEESELAEDEEATPAAAVVEQPVSTQTSVATTVEVATPVLSPVGAEARVAYDDAYTLYHQGAFGEAEAKFLEFLAMGPVNELSDNAMFWVGSTRYARGDYPGALRAFRETVETYPDQNKVPDALFKIGQCLEKVGDRPNAEEVYRELERRFPETAAATLATERLTNP